MRLPSAEEMRAASLPVIEHRVSIAPDGARFPVTWRYETEAQRDGFAAAQLDAWIRGGSR